MNWFFWAHAFHEGGAAAGIAVGRLLTSDYPHCALLIVGSALLGLYAFRPFLPSLFHPPRSSSLHPTSSHQPQRSPSQVPQLDQAHDQTQHTQQQPTSPQPPSSSAGQRPRVGMVVLGFIAASLAFSYVVSVLVPGLSFLREEGEDVDAYNYNPTFRQFAALSLVAGGVCWGFERHSSRCRASSRSYSFCLWTLGGFLSCIIAFSILFM